MHLGGDDGRGVSGTMTPRERTSILAAVEDAMYAYKVKAHVGSALAVDDEVSVFRLCNLAMNLGISREELAAIAGEQSAHMVPKYKHYCRWMHLPKRELAPSEDSPNDPDSPACDAVESYVNFELLRLKV